MPVVGVAVALEVIDFVVDTDPCQSHLTIRG